MNPSQAAVAKLAGAEEDISDLVEQASSGDHGAFEVLYRSHVGRVYALCLRIFADRSKAEDLTQQIFIRVWAKLRSFRGESSFGSWLYRLSMNVVLNELKSEEARDRRTAAADEASELVSAQEALSNLQTGPRERDRSAAQDMRERFLSCTKLRDSVMKRLRSRSAWL